MRTAGVLDPVEPTTTRRLPVRLRHVLGAVLVAAALWQGVPRAKAAWRLQALATSFADYALCMAGPTGPTLLRDNASEFWRTARRRLVTSPADAHPFQPCAELAEEITGKVEVRRAHDARAREFVEYGAEASDRAHKGRQSERQLADLEVSTLPLAELAREARPFLREGYTVLVQPTRSAVEATHPAELPRALAGDGLPAARAVYRATQALGENHYLLAIGSGVRVSAYQTHDGGLKWQPTSVQDTRVQGIEGRCFGEDARRSFTVGLDESRNFLKVANQIDGAVQHAAQLPRGLTQVLSVACDDQALVVALARGAASEAPVNDAEAELFVCPSGAPCRPLQAPLWGEGLALKAPLDLARVAGVTVVAIARHGLVRTASSRDDGRSWTPFIVAFDHASQPNLRVHVQEPSRLLTLGRRVLLYGGAPKPGLTYPVLVSDDAGASWRTPAVAPAALSTGRGRPVAAAR